MSELSLRELWRPIAKYEGLYSVSNSGRVRYEHQLVQTEHGPKRHAGAQVTIYHTDSGEPFVWLHKGPIVTAHYVIKLMEAAFPLLSTEGENNQVMD